LFEGKKIGVFHPGTQHSWQTALAFQETGQLEWYATSIFYDASRFPYRLERILPERAAKRLNAEFKRRYTPLLDIAKVRQLGLWEWLERCSSRLGSKSLAKWARRHGNTDFGYAVIRLIEREPVDVVWGYDSASLEVFRWAKAQGLFCVLDQTSIHLAFQNRILREEHAKHPEFFGDAYSPQAQSRIERQDEEVALADLVVTGSAFCARVLVENGCPAAKIRIVPYGFDASLFPATQPVRRPFDGRPLEFLYVGNLNPGKGTRYLLEAIMKVPASAAALTLVGGLAIPKPTFARYADRVRYVPAVPHSEIAGYFAAADCFIFPSLFEGSARVLCEAIGSSLGIIQTAAAGDGVRGGRNGVVLPDISVGALVDAIEAVLRDPAQLTEWQHASWEMRGERSWETYRQLLRSLPPPRAAAAG
jgi:glycosyltransferase involved in cell wall biosynthesis